MFIREFNPALQEICSGPVECRPLAFSCKYLATKCGDNGDDFNTEPRSASQYRRNAVIITVVARVNLNSKCSLFVFGTHAPCLTLHDSAVHIITNKKSLSNN